MTVLRDLVYAPELGSFGQLDLYLPDDAGTCPLLVFFHGGGLCAGDRGDGRNPVCLRLARSGIAVAAVSYRLYRFLPPSPGKEALLSADSPRYPDFIEDGAKAVAWLMQSGRQFHPFSSWYVGGSSAGAYLAMMLFFDTRFLDRNGIDARALDGFFFDAGQPTVHFNVLAERGLDSRLVRIDPAAPLYWADAGLARGDMPKICIVYAQQDIVNRREQNLLLYRTMLHLGYDSGKLRIIEMKGYGHTGYNQDVDVYAPLIENWIRA
ncbi:MAG: alpha/beta hydrolase fold domain-containing protein [Eubacteriales bacterium]|nr:alpha/beta hydrolase fold domain-containing protein [Eubacteriales bacterium]